MVKPGYKQTEIGVIPENWNAIYFRDCFEVLPNNTLSRAALNNDEGNAKNIHYGDILVKYGSLLNCSKAAIPYISNSSLHTTSKPLIDGDVVIADTAEDETVGKAVEITEVGHQLVVPGLHTIPCRAKNSNMFAPGWLGFFLNSSVYHDQLLPLITGTKVSAISKMSISDTIILAPPFPEQSQIAEALSDMDELIASLEKLIEKKKAIKQGAMQELLTGKRRLPGFSGEWKTSPLITLCDSITDGSHESPLETDCGYYMPSVKDMTDCGFNYSACKQISKLDYEKLVRNGCQPVVGDVLIAKDGSILKHAFVYEQSVPTVILSSIAIIRPNKAIIDSQYLAQYFRQKSFVESVILNYKSGTGVPRIVLNNFKIIEIFHPISVKEQIAISETLGYIDVDIEMQEKKVEKARQIKQGMMQQLLTGKIRV